ncbi:hypothetical protein [Flavobacterium sp. JP2137]|uniref:hypothetical protein n=1 Tax=Flavobacterium sp. JP2137 TaxID=3414510 RepID=UPI003D2FA9C2
MKKYAFIAIASVAFLTSCNVTKKEAVNEETPATENAAAATTSPSTESAAPAVAATAEGLNPEHGQPGHRCDIAVGAPLNTAASQNAAPAITTSAETAPQPFLVNDAAKAGTSAATGKLNPPHGEPGHRCDIQVGQPL